METTISKTQNEQNAKLIAIGAFFGCLGITSFILHISPTIILGNMAEFAAHHYFLAGFVFLVISSTSVKLYYSKNKEVSQPLNRLSNTAIRRMLLINQKIKNNLPLTREKNVKLLAMGTFFGCLGVMSFILHLSPLAIIEKLMEFTAHHYFLVGFIFLIISLSSFKIYDNKTKLSVARINNARSLSLKKNKVLVNWNSNVASVDNFQKSQFIKKEGITSLKFSNSEVLESSAEQNVRSENLHKARLLGNLYKQKVMISFKDNHSFKHTHATIWQTDDEYVSLKGGATIPVKSIYKIEI